MNKLFLKKPNAYYDNFGLLKKDTLIEEKEIKGGEVRLHVLEDSYLPQAIVYHKGKAPDDLYDTNPLTYSGLDEGCLIGFELELDGDFPFRQFINLIDNDGEETFIPLKQIIVMEIDSNLVFIEDEIEGDGEDLEDDTKDQPF